MSFTTKIEQHKIERAAKALFEKYNISALSKVVAAASASIEEGRKKEGEYWIAIADELQELQKVEKRDFEEA